MAQGLEDEFYTITEAAKALRVSVSTVWRWISDGTLPAYRVGQRRIRINRKDLAAVIKPFKGVAEAQTAYDKQQVEIYRMSPAEAKDQRAVIKKARLLQEEILKRRHGELVPPSWPDINEAREIRTAEL